MKITYKRVYMLLNRIAKAVAQQQFRTINTHKAINTSLSEAWKYNKKVHIKTLQQHNGKNGFGWVSGWESLILIQIIDVAKYKITSSCIFKINKYVNKISYLAKRSKTQLTILMKFQLCPLFPLPYI